MSPHRQQYIKKVLMRASVKRGGGKKKVETAKIYTLHKEERKKKKGNMNLFN